MENEVKKNNGGLYAIIAILCVMVLALGGFIVYDKFIAKEDKEETTEKSNASTNIDKESNTVKNNESANETTKEVKDFDVANFDTKKIINQTNSLNEYSLNDDDNNTKIGLKIALNADKRSATITIDWSKYFEIYGISATDGVIREYNVTNFDKQIRHAYIFGMGHGAGSETAYYVMEDGTVEYTPIVEGLGNNGSSPNTVLKSYGKLQNITGVVNMHGAFSNPTCENCVGGGYTPLAFKADGSFYDISNIPGK